MLSKSKIIKKWFWYRLQTKYHISFPDDISVGIGLYIPHPQNIVILNGTVIGSNCTILHNCTFGKRSKKIIPPDENIIVGNDCSFCCGCVVLTGVKIGDGTRVGANSVLNTSTEPNSVYAGVPARRIK
jgi:serine acetyltransferase